MIQLQNIRFGYHPKNILFEDVSMRMEAGHIYGLLGKNGAGKTTLLKIMTGLLFPNSGTSEILGLNAPLRKAEALRDIFFLQEEIYVPHLTIEGYLKSYVPFYPYFNHERFQYYMSELEMDGCHGYADKFSHGQKKKFLIAFALATNTKVLIMDEPTNGLDIPSKSAFRRIMASAADENRVILISTHQVRDLHSLIDMVTILERGRILLNTSVYDITSKLFFGQYVEGRKAYYQEEFAGGISAIMDNPNGEDSKIDLELFFNAMMHNSKEIAALFTEKPSSL
ncbi:MAG: ABC transporter ATP-binding protein [Bacteroidales bacterium]|nr:ABC transporter ATP-binding protein [Bacteroidales bacterium]